jgi:hypothetical protein
LKCKNETFKSYTAKITVFTVSSLDITANIIQTKYKIYQPTHENGNISEHFDLIKFRPH